VFRPLRGSKYVCFANVNKEVGNRNHLIIIGLAMLLLHGCASIYSVVEFEVLEPATVSLPENVHQLLILNRAPITTDAFERKDVQGIEDYQLIILDTLIVKSIQRGVLNVLQESPIERFHRPLWLEGRRRDTNSLDDLVLTRREVEDICIENRGDAILSLESYSTDYVEHVQTYTGYSVTATKYYEISSIIKWNIYLPGSPRPFDSYTMVDTLFFTEVMNGEFIRSYRTTEMLTEAFYVSGRKYGRYLVPVWNRTTRTLYKGKEYALRAAAKLTDQGDWEMAYAQWEELSESTDSTTAAKAYYNMAVYHELEDHLDLANEFIEIALSLDTLEMISSYKEEMETRILNRRELYKQVR
jgi:uncharacterized protein DUF6340